MSFINGMKLRAKQDIKTIVLPEATDVRILQAASNVLKEGFAKIILIGNKDKVNQIAKENNIDISKALIEDPYNSKKYDKYVETFYELRKRKGMTLDKAKEVILNEVYFGMMMVKTGTLRPALQILKTAPNTKLVSAFFMMIVPDCKYGENGIFVFSDCGLNQNPNSDELSEIAIASAKSFEQLVGKKAKVGMLSYSTYGSAKSELTSKVIEATRLVKEKAPDLLIDGELQLDAAIIPSVSKLKAPGSEIAGEANTLIFPDLNAGNIGYKLVQRFAKAEAYGPLCQGIAKPVNDLSRGCSSKDVEGVIAITAVQAQQ